MTGDDRSAVVDVVNLYALAVDTQRWDLFDTIFTTDADVDFGRGAHWRDRASLKTAFAAIHAIYDATVHTTTNHVVTVDGDDAHCISYVHGRFLRKTTSGNEFESGGWYDDLLVRDGGSWRISRRTCTMIWSRGSSEVMGMPATEGDAATANVLSALHRSAAADRIEYLHHLDARTRS